MTVDLTNVNADDIWNLLIKPVFKKEHKLISRPHHPSDKMEVLPLFSFQGHTARALLTPLPYYANGAEAHALFYSTPPPRDLRHADGVEDVTCLHVKLTDKRWHSNLQVAVYVVQSIEKDYPETYKEVAKTFEKRLKQRAKQRQYAKKQQAKKKALTFKKAELYRIFYSALKDPSYTNKVDQFIEKHVQRALDDLEEMFPGAKQRVHAYAYVKGYKTAISVNALSNLRHYMPPELEKDRKGKALYEYLKKLVDIDKVVGQWLYSSNDVERRFALNFTDNTDEVTALASVDDNEHIRKLAEIKLDEEAG